MKDNRTRFFYVLYPDKTWVFDQSERANGPICIINCYVYFVITCISGCSHCKRNDITCFLCRHVASVNKA